MTRDDIIEAASKAGFETKRDMIWVDGWEITPTLTRFAALVAAAERERIIAANTPEIERINAHIEGMRNRMISEGWRQCAQGQRTTQFCAVAEQARLEEREACARVCEGRLQEGLNFEGCAAAIRAQAADRLARHGIQLPDENEEYGNPSF
jgi:hypothetical protein